MHVLSKHQTVAVVDKDVLLIAIYTRKGSFWEFRTRASTPEIKAIFLAGVQDFESVLEAVVEFVGACV
jgi:hypothetical protein